MMPAKVKCLSVQQPWAWGIVHGPKRIENRSVRTHYRGPLFIHAGVSRARLGDERQRLPSLPAYDALTYGAIIGRVDLVGCVTIDELRSDRALRTEWLDRQAQGPFADGPFCWLLANPVAFAVPTPWRGAQGFFHVPIEQIMERTRPDSSRLQ